MSILVLEFFTSLDMILIWATDVELNICYKLFC
uniref:Uncharacterized protein n=1 Tax=Setaria italica TaxID=4555 RepID=K3XTN0_SETIT